MSGKEILIELEEPLKRISSRINAMELMVYGLRWVKAPYADGLNAIWNDLREAEEGIQKVLRTAGE